MTQESFATHLTLTGYWAGQPLCGCNRAEEAARGATFQHAIYANLDNPDLCQKCVEVWFSTDEDDEDAS